MNANLLLVHFDRIADAPDAVPRLRRFILDLAVRGRLVPQEPDDEPASELVKRIAAEKARLVKTGEVKESKSRRDKMTDEPFTPASIMAMGRTRKPVSIRRGHETRAQNAESRILVAGT